MLCVSTFSKVSLKVTLNFKLVQVIIVLAECKKFMIDNEHVT